jgi:hypothetical protein
VRRQKSRDVLDENPSGSLFFNQACEFVEEAAVLSSQASTTARHRYVLARESSDSKVVSLEVICSHILYIVVERNVRPMVIENVVTIQVVLDLSDTAHTRLL